jgi:biotin carboxylase
VPRILLVLARRTYRAEAFLDAAHAFGSHVTVASDHKASLGPMAPDDNLTLHFDDVPGSVARVEALARRIRVDAVVAAEDEGVIVAAEVARALGLRHASPEAVRAARDKARLREIMAAQHLPVPEFTVVEPDERAQAAAARLPFPCVLKPLSLSASRGVIRADDADGFALALERVRRIIAKAGPGTDRRVLVEAFLPGREVAVEGLLRRGRLRVLALLDKPDPLDGPFFEETLLVTPSRLPEPVQAAVRTHVQEVAAAIGLDEGPVHAELRVDGDRVRLLEIAPRSIGGRCSRMLRFRGGLSLEDVLLLSALDRGVEAPPLEAGASGVMMLPIPKAGVLRRVGGQGRARMVPGIESLEITAPGEQRVAPPPEGNRYLGFLFARGETPSAVEDALRAAHGYLEPVIEEGEAATG